MVNSSSTYYTFLSANLLQFQFIRLVIRCRFSGRDRVYGQAGKAAKIYQQLCFKFVGILMELESEWILDECLDSTYLQSNMSEIH